MVRVGEIKLLLQGCQRSPIYEWLLLTPSQSHCRTLPRVAIENPSLEIRAAESSQYGPVSVPTVAVPDDVELVTVQKPTSTKANSTYKKFEKNTQFYYMKRKE